MPEFKTFGAVVKAAGEGEPAGTFEAFVAVMDNVDRHGDRIKSGAFDANLAEWKASGDPLPVIWSHQHGNPDAHIGVVIDAAEKTIDGKTGLWVKGQLDMSEPMSAKVFKLLKDRRVKNFSFAYETRKSTMVEEKDAATGRTQYVRELEELGVFEVGPTLIGANGATDLLEAASLDPGKAAEALARGIADGLKAGRVLSAKNAESLAAARDLIDEVLKSAAPAEDPADPPADPAKSAPSAPRDSGPTLDASEQVRLLTRTRHDKE